MIGFRSRCSVRGVRRLPLVLGLDSHQGHNAKRCLKCVRDLGMVHVARDRLYRTVTDRISGSIRAVKRPQSVSCTPSCNSSALSSSTSHVKLRCSRGPPTRRWGPPSLRSFVCDRSAHTDALGRPATEKRTYLSGGAKVALSTAILAGTVAVVAVTGAEQSFPQKLDGIRGLDAEDYLRSVARGAGEAGDYVRSLSRRAGDAAVELADRSMIAAAIGVRRASDLAADVGDEVAALAVLARCVKAAIVADVEREEEKGLGRPESLKHLPSVRRASWLAPRVAALVADLAACSSRREVIAKAGDGAIVDWLFRCLVGDCRRSRWEASRAVAYLIQDDSTRNLVLSRGEAIPMLLRYVSSAPPAMGVTLIEGQTADVVDGEGDERRRGGVQEVTGEAAGQSPLLSVILDLVTRDHRMWSHGRDRTTERSNTKLPSDATMEDINAALGVLREGLNVGRSGSGDAEASSGRRGIHGIGMGVLGDTAIVGVQKTMSRNLSHEDLGAGHGIAVCQGVEGAIFDGRDGMKGWHRFKGWTGIGKLIGSKDDEIDGASEGYWTGLVSGLGLGARLRRAKNSGGAHGSGGVGGEAGSDGAGIMDPLAIVGRELAIPLAAWALATWAQASSANCLKIAASDNEGMALMAAVLAKETSVRWHGIKAVERLVAEGGSWAEPVGEMWSQGLMAVACEKKVQQEGSKRSSAYDTPIICLALEALTSCVIHSKAARTWMVESGHTFLRDLVKLSESDKEIQKRAAQLLASSIHDGLILSLDEYKKWTPVLLRWACAKESDKQTRGPAVDMLGSAVENLGQGGATIGQAWLASTLTTMVVDFPAVVDIAPSVGVERQDGKMKGKKTNKQSLGGLQGQIVKEATAAAVKLAQVVVQDSAAAAAAAVAETTPPPEVPIWSASAAADAVWRSGEDLLGVGPSGGAVATGTKKRPTPVPPLEAGAAVSKALKAMADLSAADMVRQRYIVEAGGVRLLRSMILGHGYEGLENQVASIHAHSINPGTEMEGPSPLSSGPIGAEIDKPAGQKPGTYAAPVSAHNAAKLNAKKVRKHALRVLAMVSTQRATRQTIAEDDVLCRWLEACAKGRVGHPEPKTRSYCRAILVHVAQLRSEEKRSGYGERGNGKPEVGQENDDSLEQAGRQVWPRFEDGVYLMEPVQRDWDSDVPDSEESSSGRDRSSRRGGKPQQDEGVKLDGEVQTSKLGETGSGELGDRVQRSETVQKSAAFDKNAENTDKRLMGRMKEKPVMDVVFIHGLCGGPFKTWRVADKKARPQKAEISKVQGSIRSNEREGEESLHEDTFWPLSWLSKDIDGIRMLTLKYKTNLSEWSGATLPLQDLSSHLLQKLEAAGIGERPFVFVTHSMGGLVAKQIIASAQENPHYAGIARGLRGVVFYSCPHFGSRLADMPWRMGYVLRPAPSIGELRSASPRLEELNKQLRQMHTKGHVSILSFCESTVTPLVEGYGGIALRMEVVPMESAYPGFGDVVVLEGTDHVNSCKPRSRSDTAYVKMLDFLKNVQSLIEKEQQQQQQQQETQKPEKKGKNQKA